MILALLLVLGASDSIVPKNWLVIEPVDRAGRRPLRPDAVFAKHLLARDAPPPAQGEVLRGETEKDCAWREATAKDDGSLEGRIGWAYTAIESRLEDVWMAKLTGASQLYVNGAGFVGDLYGYGFGGVPIALRKGRNDVYVSGVRGSFRLELWKPENKLFVASWDRTLSAGVLVVNAGLSTRHYCLSLEELGTYHYWDSELPLPKHPVMHRIPPLSVEKVPTRILAFADMAEQKHTSPLELPSENGRENVRLEVTFQNTAGPYRATFLSPDDDSVQEYAVRPATQKEQAVVLSLHGAGVDCMGQINAYSSKPEFTIIAPTNRRPYGFDWQDWGRTNAYEALVANEVDYVPLDEGVKGRVAATLALIYPPGIGVVVPGERWDDRAQPMLDYFLTFEESFNRFPGFNYEVQGVYQEQVNGRIKFHTYVVRE